MKFLRLVLCLWICSSVSWFIVYRRLNRICILLLCESCINLNYVELVHSAFQVYYILLLFCLFILLIFESLILNLQIKILIYLLLLSILLILLHVFWNCVIRCIYIFKLLYHPAILTHF